ncbi:MAG: germination protein YpeB [Clostridia bacterium]
MKNTLTIILASLLVVAIGISIYFYDKSDTAQTLAYYESDRAFSEFVSSVSKIDTALAKSVYATTPSYSVSMLAEAYSQSEMAKANLSQLPNSENNMSQTYEFISTVGDYSLAMMKKVADGSSLSDEEQANIAMLAEKTEQLAIELSIIKTQYNNGETSDYDMNITTFDNQNVQTVGDFSEESEIEPEMQEFATLIYDGPFSSHIDKLEPELIKNESEISIDDAQIIVASFLDTDIDQVQYISTVDSQIDVYKFQSSKEDDEITLDVTVQGGHVLNFINYREVGKATKTADECVEIAKEMLASQGYTEVVETYFIETDDTVTINFAFSQDDVVLYPDLLKLEIYKDDGTLAGVESRGYIMSHREREDLSAEISIDEAREVVSDKLEIQSEGMAIIPSSGQNEVLTYEFKCKNENQDNYIVYVNAKTGQIQNIVILIEEENGTLAM